MNIKPIKNGNEYRQALKVIDKYLDVPQGSKEVVQLEVLSILVERILMMKKGGSDLR